MVFNCLHSLNIELIFEVYEIFQSDIPDIDFIAEHLLNILFKLIMEIELFIKGLKDREEIMLIVLLSSDEFLI